MHEHLVLQFTHIKLLLFIKNAHYRHIDTTPTNIRVVYILCKRKGEY